MLGGEMRPFLTVAIVALYAPLVYSDALKIPLPPGELKPLSQKFSSTDSVKGNLNIQLNLDRKGNLNIDVAASRDRVPPSMFPCDAISKRSSSSSFRTTTTVTDLCDLSVTWTNIPKNCFPFDSKITILDENGAEKQIPIQQAGSHIGSKISDQGKSRRLLGVLHQDPGEKLDGIRIYVENGRSLAVSPGHLIWVQRSINSPRQLLIAGNVRKDYFLIHRSGPQKITGIEPDNSQGVVALAVADLESVEELSSEKSSYFVDDFRVSTFAYVDPESETSLDIAYAYLTGRSYHEVGPTETVNPSFLERWYVDNAFFSPEMQEPEQERLTSDPEPPVQEGGFGISTKFWSVSTEFTPQEGVRCTQITGYDSVLPYLILGYRLTEWCVVSIDFYRTEKAYPLCPQKLVVSLNAEDRAIYSATLTGKDCRKRSISRTKENVETCFPLGTLVTMQGEQGGEESVQMRRLPQMIGKKILVDRDSEGRPNWGVVSGILHLEDDVDTDFLRFTTAQGTLTLSRKHRVWVTESGTNKVITADSVDPSRHGLINARGDEVAIVAVEKINERGFIAPLIQGDKGFSESSVSFVAGRQGSEFTVSSFATNLSWWQVYLGLAYFRWWRSPTSLTEINKTVTLSPWEQYLVDTFLNS
jgi:hypothetical protein